jgi:hypothetical protein
VGKKDAVRRDIMAEIERLRVEHLRRRRREEYIRDVMLGAIDQVRLRSVRAPAELSEEAAVARRTADRSNTQ